MSPGLFDKGGISRYGRYQVAALREILGPDRVEALSVRLPQAGDFETGFEDVWHPAAGGLTGKLQFAAKALSAALRRKHQIVWAGHINFSPLVGLIARWGAATGVLNVYGREVWMKHRPTVDSAFRAMPVLVSDCHFTADYVRAQTDWAGRALHIAWDCVDTERFFPGPPRPEAIAAYGLAADEPRLKVLMLGRISHNARHKGWERLLEVAARFRGQGTVLFVLAGQGDFVGSLRSRCEAQGLTEEVRLIGAVSEDHLVDLYRYCDVFSLVSDRGEGRGEGIPLTPLEAAACAKPIIVGNQDGSRESVEEGTNGYAIDPFDIDRHADIIDELRRDENWRAAAGAAAKRRIEEHHSYPVFVKKTAAVLAAIDQ